MILQIPAVTDSPNAVKSHWVYKYRLRKKWRKLVQDAIYEARALPLPAVAPAFAAVTIERHGRKLLDADNLVASLKGLIDSLKDFRLIADDSPEHIHLTVRQRLTRLPPHMVITIQARIP